MVAHRNLTAGIVALHRGRKPVAGTVRESVARRAKARREHQHTGEQPSVVDPGAEQPGTDA